MCTGLEPAAIASIAASAAGTGISMHAQKEAADKQEREAATNVRTQSEFNRKAGARVSEQAQQLKTDNSAGDEAKAQGDFMDALRKAQLGDAAAAPAGAVSDRFATENENSQAVSKAGNAAAATNLARIDAPFMQRVRENTGAARTGSDLAILGGQAAGQDFLSQLRASLIHANPGEMAAGSLLTSAGNAYSSRAVPRKKPGIFSSLPDQRPVDGVNA